MEVKSIFVNNILKTYTQSARPGSAARESEPAHDSVSISSGTGKRLFEEMMEQSLTKSLNKDPQHESE